MEMLIPDLKVIGPSKWLKEYNFWALYLGLSLAMSFLWMGIAKNFYKYNHNFMSILGISLFPLLGWTIGLFIVYAMFRFIYSGKERGYLVQLLLFSIFYWLLLIAAETIGYHFFDIKNLAAASYSGIPICDCLHTPAWMKVAYFSMGPLFFFMCFFINSYYSKTRSLV